MKKRIIAAVLVLILLTGIVPVASAGEGTNYPFIFVHGYLGWGAGSMSEVDKPYWGDTPENNVMTYLTEKGYKAYNPNVSPMSSAWDRACELYAQLTGTVVDYGEAHSKKFGHDRYGRDYTGQAVMGEPWDLETKLNLIGHSYGGATVRVFAGLLAYGDADEIAASGENCSELFKGTHKDAVYSITTLAAPTNGSTLSDFMEMFRPVFLLIANIFTSRAYKGETLFDLNADQWGLSVPPSQGMIKTDFFKMLKWSFSDDNCAYDMSIKGAREINEKYPSIDSVYYFSFCGNITEKTAFGYYKLGDYDNIFNIFQFMGPLIPLTVNRFTAQTWIGKEWTQSDGMVSQISAMYPFWEDCKHEAYSPEKDIMPGVWYEMPILDGVDHYDFCSAAETGEFGSKQEYFDFFENLVKRVNNIGG